MTPSHGGVKHKTGRRQKQDKNFPKPCFFDTRPRPREKRPKCPLAPRPRPRHVEASQQARQELPLKLKHHTGLGRGNRDKTCPGACPPSRQTAARPRARGWIAWDLLIRAGGPAASDNARRGPERIRTPPDPGSQDRLIDAGYTRESREEEGSAAFAHRCPNSPRGDGQDGASIWCLDCVSASWPFEKGGACWDGVREGGKRPGPYF